MSLSYQEERLADPKRSETAIRIVRRARELISEPIKFSKQGAVDRNGRQCDHDRAVAFAAYDAIHIAAHEIQKGLYADHPVHAHADACALIDKLEGKEVNLNHLEYGEVITLFDRVLA